MIRTRTDIPLERDAASRLLPWIISIMVYLAVLAIAGAIALNAAIRGWSAGVSNTVTVQVPFDGTENKTIQTAERVAAILKRERGVVAVSVLRRSQVAALVRPWLGAGSDLADLPLPLLVDATVADDAVLDLAAVSRRVRAVSPGASLEDHQRWLSRLVGFARSIWLVTLLVVVLIVCAAIVTVIFTTRTGLRIHLRVIEVLHLIGAHDRYISRQFERQAVLLSLRGALIGGVLAVVTVVALAHLADQVDLLRTPRYIFSLWQWALFVAVPVVAGLVALYTARFTVLRTLARLT